MPSVIEAPENLYGLKRNTRPKRVKRRDGVWFLLAVES
jgi:hypothetical protein